MASVRFCVYEWFSTLGRRQVDDLKEVMRSEAGCIRPST